MWNVCECHSNKANEDFTKKNHKNYPVPHTHTWTIFEKNEATDPQRKLSK